MFNSIAAIAAALTPHLLKFGSDWLGRRLQGNGKSEHEHRQALLSDLAKLPTERTLYVDQLERQLVAGLVQISGPEIAHETRRSILQLKDWGTFVDTCKGPQALLSFTVDNEGVPRVTWRLKWLRPFRNWPSLTMTYSIFLYGCGAFFIAVIAGINGTELTQLPSSRALSVQYWHTYLGLVLSAMLALIGFSRMWRVPDGRHAVRLARQLGPQDLLGNCSDLKAEGSSSVAGHGRRKRARPAQKK